jgi:hypothetical protein
MSKKEDKEKALEPQGGETLAPEESAAPGNSPEETSGERQNQPSLEVKREAPVGNRRELFLDSTSIQDIQVLLDQEESTLLADKNILREVARFEEVLLKDETRTTAEKLAAAEDLTNRFVGQFNIANHATDSIVARYAITVGTLCNHAKDLVKRSNQNWEEWADEHIRLKDRSRQKYMRLAARRDCYDYAFLGLERLTHLVSATEGMTSEDPIGDLLGEFKIPVEPDKETNLELFKNRVDGALAVIRARSSKVEIDFDRVTRLIALGVKFDQKLIKDLARIKNSEGDPNLHLERLLANQGKEEVVLDEDKELERVNEAIRKVSTSLENLRKKFPQLPELVRKLNIALVQRLQGQLMALISPFDK